ncbi:MAG: hypothetical protein JXX28_01030 [Deltaproteobacteria bacterium]|nr:hypothetical protein [Deltaproteobacteria bacterium]
MRTALALSLLLWGSTALADTPDWSAVVDGAALAAELGGTGHKVLVAAPEDAEPAAVAIRAALREHAALVMDDRALGGKDELGDEDILTAAANLPVDRVLVVRIYPGAGDELLAVGTAFDKGGTSVGSFSLSSAGGTLEASAPAAQTAAPVPQQAVAAPAPRSSREDPSLARAWETYDRSFYHLEMQEHTSAGYLPWGQYTPGYVVVSSATYLTPYRGIHDERVQMPTFYRHVGMRKLRRTTQLRWAATGGLVSVGLPVTVVSVLFMGAVAVGDFEGVPGKRYEMLGIGAGFLAVGVLTIHAARRLAPKEELAYGRHYVSNEELKNRVDAYNRRLRKQLGLPEEEETDGDSLLLLPDGDALSALDLRPQPEWRLSPWAGPSGGGISLRVDF